MSYQKGDYVRVKDTALSQMKGRAGIVVRVSPGGAFRNTIRFPNVPEAMAFADDELEPFPPPPSPWPSLQAKAWAEGAKWGGSKNHQPDADDIKEANPYT